MALTLLRLMSRRCSKDLHVQDGLSSMKGHIFSLTRYSTSAALSCPRVLIDARFRFASTQARPPLQLSNASQFKNSVLINWKEGDQEKSYQSKFDNMWLRENCQCSQCYIDNLRKVDTTSLHPNIQPKQVTQSGGTSLKIQWPDGHESIYPADWLLKNTYDGSDELFTKVPESDPVKEPISWGGEIGTDPPRVGYDAVMKEDTKFLEMSEKIEVHGFCLVEDTPLDPARTEELVRRIGVLRNVFHGGLWRIDPDLQKNFRDAAYTHNPIEPHTDGVFFHEAPGLNVFHAIKFEGPEPCYNYFVDGQKLCEVIKEENSAHFEILCNVPFRFQRVVDGQYNYYSVQRIFVIDPETKKLSKFHFKNQSRMPLNKSTLESLHKINPSGSLSDVYAAIQTLVHTIRRKELHFMKHLEPGTAIVFNNHRVMHARTGFKGKRTLLGAFINREDWRSRVMSLRSKRVSNNSQN